MTEKKSTGALIGSAVASAAGGSAMLYGLRHGDDSIATMGVFWLVFWALLTISTRFDD